LVIVAAWILGTIQISRQLSKDLPAACERRAVDAVVTVTSFPQTTQTADFHQVRFRGDIAIADPLCARVRTVDVTWYDPTEHIELGDVLQVTAVLLPLRSQHSPGVAPDLLQRRVQAEHARVRLKSVFKQQSAARFSVARLRLGIAAQIREAVADPFAQRVLIALTVGDQGALSEDDWRLFRHLGLSHVMVISGLHIGLVAWCAYALVGLPRRCYRLPGDRGSIRKAVVAALVVATLYALLAGLSLPVLRALAMLYALLVTKLLGWQTNPLWTLGLVAVVLAALQPFVLVSGSFYFSFGAVALLLWSRAVVGTWRPWQAAVFVQVLMTLASLPLSLFWFGEGSLLAIPVNLLVTPILSLVVVPAAVCLALVGVLWSGLSVPWHWLGDGLALLLQVLVSGSQWVGTWGVITIDLYLPALLAFAALIVGLVCLKGTLRRLALALAGVALMAEALRPPSQPLLAVLDVGQGTAVVLRTPTHTLLYDTGGGNPGVYTQAEKVVLPFLQWARLPWARRGTLTQFIVSHGDQDHSAGLAVVREHMAPGDHWGFGGKACRPGQVLWSDETLFLQVLGGTGHDKDARNADSCVLRMEFGGMTVLLAGDVPVKTELAMVRYWREALAADILVVGHHGSATSTSEAWLRWVAPQRAALSYARANPFGHPAEDVVGRLQRRGIAIDSTAHRGTLLYRGAGHGVIDVRSSRSPWTPRWLYLPQDK
jgi:competence protein ComEC